MRDYEDAVVGHYGGAGLLDRIMAGLRAAGADLDKLTADDLAPVDEFHIGGRGATVHVASKLALTPDRRVLDVGCGIGGAARFIATQSGCKVTGIDLTPGYISVAETLTELTGLGDKLDFKAGSALAMPFEDASFDAAISIHVAMNIRDRAALYGEIARVLKPDATLCIYDVMKKSDGALTYPVPWAQTTATSFLTTPVEMSALLEGAGFDVAEVDDRTASALEFFQKRAAAAADGPPPLGIHLVLGAEAPQKLGNLRRGIENGCVAPVQMVARRKAE